MLINFSDLVSATVCVNSPVHVPVLLCMLIQLHVLVPVYNSNAYSVNRVLNAYG
jgi:hypothetical protein